MKKLLITTISGLALVAATISCFGQGTVTWINDGNTADTYATPALFGDYAPQPFGTPVTGPSGTYEYGLYIGPLGTSNIFQMTLVSTCFNFSQVFEAGSILGGSVTLPSGYPNGTAISDVVAGWTAADGGDYFTAVGEGNPDDVSGISEVGFVTPNNPNGVVFGHGPGQITGLYIGLVPEPGTIVLGGLGAAALLFFRRKKK